MVNGEFNLLLPLIGGAALFILVLFVGAFFWMMMRTGVIRINNRRLLLNVLKGIGFSLGVVVLLGMMISAAKRLF